MFAYMAGKAKTAFDKIPVIKLEIYPKCSF
jgi:hypothetical protein